MLQLGIDIGGSSVKAALLENGQLAWTGQSATYSRPDSAQLIAAIVGATGGRVSRKDDLAAGLCAPGVFDPVQRRITAAVNAPGLTELSLDELLRQSIGSHAKLNWIGSDAVAAATDAARAKGLSGRVFGLAIGTGVGAAVLDDGKPLLVSGNSPGHWGQVDVSLAGEEVVGPDGGAGGLEGYIGAPALRRRYGVNDLSSAVAKMSADQPPVRALVRAIRIAHAIYRPQHVLLLGGIGIRMAHLANDVHRLVSENLTSVARPGWTLSLGYDTWHAARGAAHLAG